MKKKKKKEPPLKTNKYRGEKWFPLLGHENMYEISDYGRLKQIRTSSGQLIKIIQKGIKLKRDGRKELIVNVVSPKTGIANYVPLRFLMEMQFSKVMCRHNLVRCIGYLKNLGYDFDECFELAYQEIKDRKGLWIDGSFVKWEELPDGLRAKIK